MGKSLVIVESPAKAKTINKYLGKDFIVKSSVGHIRDLSDHTKPAPSTPAERARKAAETRKLSPEEKAIRKAKDERQKQFRSMNLYPEDSWKAFYSVMPDKEKVVKELKSLAEKADLIYLATDLDREGEAIAWHLKEVIGGDDSRYKRVVFNEITKKAIQEAFEEPGNLNLDRVNAQQARRFLDRVVGFMLSPLLWAKVARGLSAGRVQSPALRMLVSREKDINAFEAEEYWELFADTQTNDKSPLRLQLDRLDGKAVKQGKKTSLSSKAMMDELLARIEAASRSSTNEPTLQVIEREDKPTTSRPSPPFTTSTLQQAASSRLGFGVKRTMQAAQSLYEAGYITYMRTDSTHLSMDAVLSCRDHISDDYGLPYLPEKPIFYKSKGGAQEAHEAIRPSDVAVRGKDVTDVRNKDASRLYELIWRRFVACQMSPAKYKASSITASVDQIEFKAKGRVLVFDGYTRVMGRQEDEALLPSVQKGDLLAVTHLDPQQKFTRPPARFTEAALVKSLEKEGIGRPSTYASIISVLQDRGYARLDNKRFHVEKVGEIVSNRLNESFHDLVDYEFTKRLEEKLDDISEGHTFWKDALDEFYQDFIASLDKASQTEGGMRPNTPVVTDIACNKCGRPMAIRNAQTGTFLGCTGYNLKGDDKCKNTMDLSQDIPEIEGDLDEEEKENLTLRQRERCHICNSAMTPFLLDATRKVHICSNTPECTGFKVETGKYLLPQQDTPTIECDKCGSDMELKSGRFGRFFACTNSECSNTRKVLKNGEAAPPKMDPIAMESLACRKVDDFYLLRDGANGLFLAASKFPKNRETRAPKLLEILPYKQQLDSKYHFLLDGPTSDPDGNDTIVRFDRKKKVQYLGSENTEGKATRWRAYKEKGAWVSPAPKAKAKK